VGRLFDAVSALLTGRHIVNYEGQAAIELEQLADPAAEEVFPIDIMEEGEGFLLPSESFLRPVVEGLRRGRPRPVLAAAFHNTLAGATAEVCSRIAKRTGIREVALSGGVFQNVLLLNRLQAALEKSGLTCITHRRVPANDGGISLGQAVIGERRACA
jgi:hydrogenase maturation protein HypF